MPAVMFKGIAAFGSGCRGAPGETRGRPHRAAPTAFECYAKLGFGSAPEGLVTGADDGVDVRCSLALDEVTHRGFAGLARTRESGAGDAVADLAPEAALLEVGDAVRP